MDLRDDQIEAISFFKSKDEFKSFIRDYRSEDRDRASDFYKWQLIRRNKAYIEFYDLMRDENEELKANETLIMWGMDTLMDPQLIHPAEQTVFHYKTPFSLLSRFSYHDFNHYLEEGLPTPFSDEELLRKLNQLDVEAHFTDDHGKRFMLIAFDLDQNLAEEELKSFKDLFKEQRNKYLNDKRSENFRKLNARKSMLELEKSLFIYDNYKLGRDSFIGLEKKFKNRFGSPGLDLKSIKDRLATVTRWIENARDIQIRIENI